MNNDGFDRIFEKFLQATILAAFSVIWIFFVILAALTIQMALSWL